MPDPVTPDNRFALRGYQFDLDGGKRYVGNNYEEKGRLFVAVRGQVTRIVEAGRPSCSLTTAMRRSSGRKSPPTIGTPCI